MFKFSTTTELQRNVLRLPCLCCKAAQFGNYLHQLYGYIVQMVLCAPFCNSQCQPSGLKSSACLNGFKTRGFPEKFRIPERFAKCISCIGMICTWDGLLFCGTCTALACVAPARWLIEIRLYFMPRQEIPGRHGFFFHFISFIWLWNMEKKWNMLKHFVSVKENI